MNDEKKSMKSAITFEGILDIFTTITTNMIDQVGVITKNLTSTYSLETEKFLDEIDSKDDYFSELLHQNLLKGLFLPLNKHDLFLIVQNIDQIMDLLQKIHHHLWLLTLPGWIITHLQEMLEIVRKQLENTLKCLEETQNTKNHLNEIRELENQADKLHREFLRELYQNDLEYKEFTHATLLDQTLEDITDNIEIFSRHLFILLNQNKALITELPHYLS